MKQETTMKALELLQDIYSTLEQGGAVWPDSLIFAEDEPAVDVLRKFLDEVPAALRKELSQ